MKRPIFLFFALTLTALMANAASITFNLYTGGTGGLSGRTFTSGGLTLTATAWSLLNQGTTFSDAELHQYNPYGLGVCNQNEQPDCDSPQHQVDNDGSFDFVLFQFSGPVTLTNITLYGVDAPGSATPDRDASYFVSNSVNTIPLNLDTKTTSDLSGFGFGSVQAFSNSAGFGTVTDNFPGLGSSIRGLLFGANISSDYDDFFKIKSLTVDYQPIPEPRFYAMLLAGLIAMAGVYARRRRTAE